MSDIESSFPPPEILPSSGIVVVGRFQPLHLGHIELIRKANDFPCQCETLPLPNSLRVDKSFVEERASYNFSYKSFQTSYQGEYPVKMSKLTKANFFSFDALKALGSINEVKNFLLFMNLDSLAVNNSAKKIIIYDSEDNSKLYEFNAVQNEISILDLSVLANEKFSEQIFFLSSNEATFIPLMLSLDVKTNHLSLEHTHPPSEIFFGQDKNSAIKVLKNRWIK